jgi:acyl-CoA thioesterase FadM
MNLLFRLFAILVESLFRRKLHPLSESVVHFRVLPNDLDLNMHMNNGRYLAIMDLGRMDLLLRAELLPLLLKHRWQPLAGAVNIRYRQSLPPFKVYRLHTKIVAWDEKWFYIEQRFERKNRLIATAHVKALFRSPKGNVSPAEVFGLLKMNIDPPKMPERVKKWIETEM